MMNREKFAEACAASGYCTKRTAMKYAEQSGKERFDEADFIEAYRMANRTHGADMRPMFGINGKTSKRFSSGNSGEKQDCGGV